MNNAQERFAQPPTRATALPLRATALAASWNHPRARNSAIPRAVAPKSAQQRLKQRCSAWHRAGAPPLPVQNCREFSPLRVGF